EALREAGQAFEAGRVIGRFHFMLSTLDCSEIADTIPDFHNLDSRASQFQSALEEDLAGRADQCRREIEFMQEALWEVRTAAGTASLPQRIVHNDTKINNVLFDKDEKGVCMVDLDTVMRGTVLFDTGDALRTLCNPSGEDGGRGPVGFHEEAYVQFITGYLSRAKDFLTRQELSLIPYSMLRMSAEQCVRFLTDHLQGDLYYHQPFTGFNLKAVQVQQEFIRMLRRKRAWMEERWAGLVAGLVP
ncbi:MAG TPA: aminoglycoside phosphotransferase family protein, partial [Saprospiraceae bacterium]|nr:aminoglycoside phosphotransferase family protein [Saprospiraceae bacterium]